MLILLLALFLVLSKSSCIDDPTQSFCTNYVYPVVNSTQDIDALCYANQQMFECTIIDLCKVGNAHGQYCNPFGLLKSLCAKLPLMQDCGSYQNLCSQGSLVKQCATPVLSLPKQVDVVSNVDSICDMLNMKQCPCDGCDLLVTYSELCKSMPDDEECSEWATMCSSIPDWNICNDDSPMFVSPCVANPVQVSCEDYTYPFAEQDLSSLCLEMPFMPECTIKNLCDAGLYSPYCEQFALLKSICFHTSPSPPKCSNFLSMCNTTDTTVIQCNIKFLPLPTVKTLRTNIHSICSLMNMDGCTSCGATCNLLMVYSMQCMHMPMISACHQWETLCKFIPDWSLCKSIERVTHLPHMKTYFHIGFSEYIYLQSLIPQTELQFFGACVFLFLLCLVHRAIRQLQQQQSIWKKIPEAHPKTYLRIYSFGLQVAPFRWSDIVLFFLTFIEVILGLTIMLLSMTFNFWFLLTVGVGYAVGEFLFSRIFLVDTKSVILYKNNTDNL